MKGTKRKCDTARARSIAFDRVDILGIGRFTSSLISGNEYRLISSTTSANRIAPLRRCSLVFHTHDVFSRRCLAATPWHRFIVVFPKDHRATDDSRRTCRQSSRYVVPEIPG